MRVDELSCGDPRCGVSAVVLVVHDLCTLVYIPDAVTHAHTHIQGLRVKVKSENPQQEMYAYIFSNSESKTGSHSCEIATTKTKKFE